jgi:hypothetical protein
MFQKPKVKRFKEAIHYNKTAKHPGLGEPRPTGGWHPHSFEISGFTRP